MTTTKKHHTQAVKSTTIPLRSIFLDPVVNNIPRSRTQSELKKTLRRVNLPHSSYDIDGDGDVSPDDFIVARRCDADKSGMLEGEEQDMARKSLARDFFKRHASDYHLYGRQWTGDPDADADKLAGDTESFAYTIGKLRTREKRLVNTGSETMIQCMSVPYPELTKHNYYSNKFDATAWNDFGANPRKFVDDSSSRFAGSRQMLFQSRNNKLRDLCAAKLQQAESKKTHFSTRRVSLITNWAIENG